MLFSLESCKYFERVERRKLDRAGERTKKATNDEWEVCSRRGDAIRKQAVIYDGRSNKKRKITNCTWVGPGLASLALIEKKYKRSGKVKKTKTLR